MSRLRSAPKKLCSPRVSTSVQGSYHDNIHIISLQLFICLHSLKNWWSHSINWQSSLAGFKMCHETTAQCLLSAVHHYATEQTSVSGTYSRLGIPPCGKLRHRHFSNTTVCAAHGCQTMDQIVGCCRQGSQRSHRYSESVPAATHIDHKKLHTQPFWSITL